MACPQSSDAIPAPTTAKRARAGWPLGFCEEGGFDYHSTFSPCTLAMDIGIGILLASTIGWLFANRVK